MPLAATQLINPIRSTEFVYTLDDNSKETVKFSYRPGVITKAFMKEIEGVLQMADSDEDAAKRLLDSTVIRLITSWDVLKEPDSEERLPLTAEALFPLDIGFEGALLMAAITHIKSRLGGATRGRRKPARSPNISNPTGKPTAFRKR